MDWDAYLEPSCKYKQVARHAQTLHSIVNDWSRTPITYNTPPWPFAETIPSPYAHADCTDMMGAGEKKQRNERTEKEAARKNTHHLQWKAKVDVEQQNDHGVRFLFCVYTTCPFRPMGPSRVDPKTLVADLRAIRDWEFLLGKKWVPYAVSGE